MSNYPDLLDLLTAQGHGVAIQSGSLAITPASGSPVPINWLAENQLGLVTEIVKRKQLSAFVFIDHSTGCYPYPGLQLQFVDLLTGESAYTVFNADLKRARNSRHGKKGSALPAQQFRLTKHYNFYKFWLSTGVKVPPRLSAFHDYMGNLKPLIFTGEMTPNKAERIASASLQPLNIRFCEVVIPDNTQTTTKQMPDNSHTTLPNKELPQVQQQQGLGTDSATGPDSYGNKVTRGHGYKGKPTPPIENQLKSNSINTQTTDEWLADYTASPT